MITVNDISVQFGGTTLFSEVSFAINENDKIALMGKNGAGKSTLLKIISGQSKPSTGNVSAPKDAVVAYLPQHLLFFCYSPNLTTCSHGRYLKLLKYPKDLLTLRTTLKLFLNYGRQTKFYYL